MAHFIFCGLRFLGWFLMYVGFNVFRTFCNIERSFQRDQPRCACLSEAKASHSHRMWAEISSPILHLLHIVLSASPSRWRCLLWVLCPVSMPVTTLAWALVKYRNLALVLRLGPEINPRACLWVPLRPCHLALCWLTNQLLSFCRITCLETPRAGSGPKKGRAEPSLASLSAVSLPFIPAWPGTQYSPTACRKEIMFNALWHCHTKGELVLVAFECIQGCLTEQILTYLCDLYWSCIS
jgi:hypothetical protein